MKMPAAGGVCAALTLLVFFSGCTALLERSYSLDHSHHAELSVTPGGMVVHKDGLRLARHPLVDPDSLRLSENGLHLAYVARQGLGWAVFLDRRQIGPAWEAVLPASLKLGDGGQLVYVARRGQAFFLVHAEQGELVLAGPYDGVTDVQVDRLAAHVVYAVRRGAAAWVVWDRDELGPLQALAELRLSPIGGRWAAIVRRQERWWVLHDGLAEPHDSAAGLQFSPNGEKLYYVARDGGRERVLEDGNAADSPSFAHIEWRTLRSVDRNGPAVYVAEEAEQRFVVFGREPGPAYDAIHSLRVSGPRYSYVGRRGSKEQAVIDGQPGPWFDEVADLITAAAGAAHAYLARQGTELRLILPGRELPLRWALAGSLALCEDGSHFGLLGVSAISTGSQSPRVLVDGIPGRSFESEEPEEVLRVFGIRGLKRWIETELHCVPPGR